MNVVDAREVNKVKQGEQEAITAVIEANVAVVLPNFVEDVESGVKIDLEYGVIAKAINDYIERYTIDPRIYSIDYKLSIPKLPDDEATHKLQEALTGAESEIHTPTGVIHVDNHAIESEKVQLKFELSIEENVFLDDLNENSQAEKKDNKPIESSQKRKVSRLEVKSSPTTAKDHQITSNLVIKSAEPALYWENASSETLQELTPSQNKKSFDKKKIIDTSLESSNIIGSGLDTANDSIVNTFKNAKVSDNGNVYLNKHARGNGSYKIVGKVSESKAVKNMGVAGKVLSYGSTAIEAGMEFQKAETTQEKGKIVGGTVGKVAAGTAAGAIAGSVTTTVLVTIAGVAGVASAPVTLVVIAGCSIVAATMASTAAEEHGEYWGGKAGEGAVNFWENRTKK